VSQRIVEIVREGISDILQPLNKRSEMLFFKRMLVAGVMSSMSYMLVITICSCWRNCHSEDGHFIWPRRQIRVTIYDAYTVWL